MIKAIFIDIDNTLLDFDAYVKESLRSGFEKFGICTYEDWMHDAFERENRKLWLQIEDGSLSFEELQKIRFNKVFEAIGVEFDGPTFEKYFREYLNESAIPVEGAMKMLEYLSGKYILCTASNGPYNQQVHRLELADMLKYFRHHFISEEIGTSKPSKEFFDVAVSRLNEGERAAGNPEILPSEIMIIGDSLTSDMAGGIGSGLKTCWLDKADKGNSKGMTLDYIVKRLDTVSVLV